MARRKTKHTGESCVFEDCTREGYGDTGLCSACYAFMHYWKGRSPGDVLNHVSKLKFWASRSTNLVPKVRAKVTPKAKGTPKAKVVPIKTSRRRAA
jgi:hypothetical protein